MSHNMNPDITENMVNNVMFIYENRDETPRRIARRFGILVCQVHWCLSAYRKAHAK
jgi:hypothetical protein